MSISTNPGATILRIAKDAVSVPGGQVIFREGDPGDQMFVVQDGTVDLLVHERLVESVGKDGIFGEMALIDHKTRSATAIARTDCQLVPINEQSFLRFVQQRPNFAILVMRVIVERLRRMDAII